MVFTDMAPTRDPRYRLATTDDVPAMQSVVHECWAADYPTVISSEAIKDGLLEWYEEEHLRREIRSADAVVAVSETDDVLSGFAHAVLDGEEGTILRLYVLPRERRSGIGTDLVEFTVAELEDRGVDRVFALALARNDVAAEFYGATGFERIRTEKTTIAGERYDELVFERPI